MWLAFLQGVSFSSAPLLSFSPFKLFVLSSALREGWRKALPLSLTPLVADIPVILVIWLVVQQLPNWSLNVLRIIGGLFYIYLAIGLTRNSGRTVDAETVLEQAQPTFWQAITAIWITPGVYINWSVIGVPALIGYAEQSPATAIAFLAGFYLLWVSGLAVQIILMGQAGKLHENITRYVIYAASILLVGFAIYQAWLGITNLAG
jgi:threonine/homoserine/homoserine lactone efflux protein